MPSASSPALARCSTVTDHGGDLGAARLRFRGAPEPWIDLSTGINPWAYPIPPCPPELWQRLPDPATLETLTAAAAQAFGVPDARHITAAPGSQSLIQWLPRLRPPGRVAVLGPTYAEHAASWTAAGHQVSLLDRDRVPDQADHLYHESWDTVVVVNPNNPDGRTLDPDQLRILAASQARRQGWLVVDEAFADLTPAASVTAAVGQPGLVVLRSFGKFFGLAGLRLGFALTEPGLAAVLRQALGPWPVSGPAAMIAGRALADQAWIAETRIRLAAAAERLDQMLTRHSLTLLGGTSLFRLAQTDTAQAQFGHLGRAGILVRRFDAHPHWLRFGLPADETAWRRLEAALS